LRLNCDGDCDCDVSQACLSNNSQSACFAECGDDPSICTGDPSGCVIGRAGSFPDHSCDCSVSYSQPQDETMSYCTDYSGDTCCSANDLLVYTDFTNPCNSLSSERCLHRLKDLHCAACSSNAASYFTHTNFLICQSFVDSYYGSCQNQKICPPKVRCLSANDCDVMRDFVSADKVFDWSTQKNFESYLKNELGYIIVDDSHDKNSVCFKNDAASATSIAVSINAMVFVVSVMFLILSF